MPTEAPIFTPEVEELLREIAKEPNSVLLRMPREKVKASLMEKRSPVGPMTAGLSNAERELVRVHREEFALQLRRASWVKLAGDGVGPVVVNRQWQGHGRIPLPSDKEARAGIARVVRRPGLSEESENSVSEWFDSARANWPSAAEIAALAHRIAPKSQDLIYAGADLLIHKAPQTALECFGDALQCEPDRDVWNAIVANIANCYEQLGQFEMSIFKWKLAHNNDPQRVYFVGCWFIVAMRAGHDREILAADRELNKINQHTQPIEELANQVRGRRRLGFWSSTPTLRSALERWSSRLGSGGGTIAQSLS
jgi:tetratricopeptide (TPR) repeat protein